MKNVILEAKRRESILLAVALVFACIFAACGNDSSSSSVSPEPTDDSSSSVIPASSGDLQSSSSQKSSNKEKSSSSVEKAKESSSSVKPSSSSEAKSSSSEEVKQSSSSVVTSSSSVTSSETVKSSSSEYVPFDHSKTLAADWNIGPNRYKTFVDKRTGRSYYYITIDGVNLNGDAASVTVMAENLNIGVDVPGTQDQNDDSVIERYCYDDDTTKCDEFGGLYQWAEMMQLPSRCNKEHCADLIKPNHQGICPDGWRLLTFDDFYVILNSEGNESGIKGLRSTYYFGGNNETGYSLVGAGYNWKYQFRNLTTGTYWFYPEESEEVNYPEEGAASFTTDSGTNTGKFFYLKTHGFSVRCVMVE